MASILKKGLSLVLVGLLVSCCMLGCTSSKTTKAATGTEGAMGSGPTEQPKAWGDETRQSIMKGD